MPNAAALRLAALPGLLAAALTVACGNSQSEAAAPNEAAPPNGAALAAEEAPAPIEPWSYPAPVSGRLSEVNTGDFALVDGIAHPARDATKGTVVFVTAEPIASPLLATSPCAASQARALTLLRDSGYAEVTLDAEGSSATFIYGTPYGGQSRGIEAGSREWPGEIAVEGKRAKGSVRHRHYGNWTFDLPIAPTDPREASEEDRMAAGYAAWGGDAPTPTEADALAAYDATYRAVMGGDLARYLELLGFDDEQSRAIRGLAGIDEDFRAHRDRFLDPGTPEPSTLEPGFAAVGARGVSSQGEAFVNHYEFTPCGGKLLLTGIGLNPQ
jgi:hypothetical protein